MTTRVLVIGGGVAGTAAAVTARDGGAEVVVVRGRAGATELTSGAVDRVPWGSPGARVASAPSPEEAVLIERLGVWRVPAAGALVATLAGRVRPAAGHDVAVLDLAALGDATVAVPRCDRAAWDADALAAAWTAEARERGLGTTFRATPASILREAWEARASDVDLAALHDDPARAAWLGARLAEAASGAAAVLVGPWLGTCRGVAAAVSRAAGVPVGETLSSPGGPGGERLAAACAELLARAGATVRSGRVVRLSDDADGVAARLDDGEQLRADAAIVAIGGLVAGGVALAAPPAGLDVEPHEARVPFVAGLSAPLVVGARGEALPASSADVGPAFEELAWGATSSASVLERVGFLADRDGRARGCGRIWLAGDARADGLRTVLAALGDGARAGRFSLQRKPAA